MRKLLSVGMAVFLLTPSFANSQQVTTLLLDDPSFARIAECESPKGAGIFVSKGENPQIVDDGMAGAKISFWRKYQIENMDDLEFLIRIEYGNGNTFDYREDGASISYPIHENGRFVLVALSEWYIDSFQLIREEGKMLYTSQNVSRPQFATAKVFVSECIFDN